MLPLAALLFAVTILVIKARPAIIVNGWGFFTRSGFDLGRSYATTVNHIHGVAVPLGASYGAGSLIIGTLESSAIAVIIALPISIGAAFALTERMPRWVSQPLGFFIELLAGVPSVLFGLWGILTLGPWLAQHVYPTIANNMPNVPVLNFFRGSAGHGEGLLTTGLVLALMIVPIITATTRDLFSQVPALPKEGGEALGMAMVSGSLLASVAPNAYGTFGTLAAAIVTQLDSASTDGTGFAVSTLAELGLILAVISVAVNLAARLVIKRSARLGAPVGRAA